MIAVLAQTENPDGEVARWLDLKFFTADSLIGRMSARVQNCDHHFRCLFVEASVLMHHVSSTTTNRLQDCFIAPLVVLRRNAFPFALSLTISLAVTATSGVVVLPAFPFCSRPTQLLIDAAGGSGFSFCQYSPSIERETNKLHEIIFGKMRIPALLLAASLVVIFDVSESLVTTSQQNDSTRHIFRATLTRRSRRSPADPRPLHPLKYRLCTRNSPSPFVLSSFSDATADNDATKNNNDEGIDIASERTLYQVLQVRTTATRDEIKQSYFRLAKQSHPDALIQQQQQQHVAQNIANNGGDYNRSNSMATIVDFQEIAEAWNVLGNSKLRKRYDRERKAKEWSLKAQAYTNERLEQAVPVVANMMDNIAVPFLRRTTATTWAVGQAIATGVSGFSKINKNGNSVQTPRDGVAPANGFADSPPVGNTGTNERTSTNGGLESINGDAMNGSNIPQAPTTHVPMGLTDTFLQALEAGQQAAREIDSLELNEKAEQLQERYVFYTR